MYGVGNRDEYTEMKARYDAMVNFLSDILNCGRWDIEDLVDSNNNIEVGIIVKNYVEEVGMLPSYNTVLREAIFDFASEYGLEVGKDIDIYTNGCLDSHIYAREDLNEQIKERLEELYGMSVLDLAV